MGSDFTNHIIRNVDTRKENIKESLEQKSTAPLNIEMSTKVKDPFMVFQKPPKVFSQVDIIAAHTQTNNECSDFTNGTVVAAKYVVEKISNTYLLRFGVDGVSVEIMQNMDYICDFLKGKKKNIGSVNNNHNIKN